jgi:hypothetical protein
MGGLVLKAFTPQAPTQVKLTCLQMFAKLTGDDCREFLPKVISVVS